jgi:dolichyl-phosphate-mannose-protein mannosyltransferase
MTPSLKNLRISRDWVIALGFGTLAALFRFWNLGLPKGKIFDEIYYAADASSLLLSGVEVDAQSGQGGFIAHPPVGKWLIAIGIKLFGYNEFGWRFSAALVGSISVVLMYFTAKKLFNNQMLSIFATVLILADGLHLVHSRTALLDIFLLLFIQIAVLAFLSNKYWLTGLALGLAIATKWNGLYLLLLLALLVLILDFRWFRYLGYENSIARVISKKLLTRFTQFAVIPLITYVTSWTGWFVSSVGWDRNWSSNPFKSLWHYHYEILNFHTTLTQPHPYEAGPLGWLIMRRPTSFFYETSEDCGVSKCSQEVLALGTPILWWAATIALLATIWLWIRKGDFQAGILLAVIGALYLPWFLFPERTMFTFYALTFQPFLLLTLVYLLSKIGRNQQRIAIIFGAIVVANFLYFTPLYYGASIAFTSWSDHMWFTSWI